MIKRVIEISSQAASLHIVHRQLSLVFSDGSKESIPCEDIGMLIVDHPRVAYSHSALSALAEEGAVVVICGRNHMVTGMLLPVGTHGNLVSRLNDQILAPQPRKKRIWQQIVRSKILAQANVLGPHSPAYRRLRELALNVKSGDPTNSEGVAAQCYWREWPSNATHGSKARFLRDKEANGTNAALNYGYAILRAAVARAIVSAGLHPALGVQHSNRGNAFCLADDLMEPIRPLIDTLVRGFGLTPDDKLTKDNKAALLEVLYQEVRCGDFRGPLMVALHRYVASFVRCLQGLDRSLICPNPTTLS